MPRTAPLLTAVLDPGAAEPLFRQLYEALRRAILAGRPGPGERLPATRTLAQELGVSRTTVVSAYEQLLAEGYLTGRMGAGTFVSASLPEERLEAALPPATLPGARSTPALPRPRPDAGVSLARPYREAVPFRAGVPALDAFPLRLWERLASRRWRTAGPEHLGYGDSKGYPPLREAIAAHLATARAVRCAPEQVLIVAGAQQGFDLVARVLLRPGDRAWMEEPGYRGAKAALAANGIELVPVPVDAEGLDVAAGVGMAPQARLAYVTPSHQYPLGVTLSLPRRLALLAWARAAGAWVLEDDYDSEFRHAGRPLAALHGLDAGGNVLYLGTFSKALFPALRLGYLVVPVALVEEFDRARSALDLHPPTHAQAVVADFLTEGHFARHVRRMRTLYAERQEALVKAVRRALGDWLEVAPADTGLQLVGWLAEGLDDRAVARAAAAVGVDLQPLSQYRLTPGGRGGFLLGYAAHTPARIREGVRRLAGVNVAGF
jgi:GntR family transcriptional regulator/MocR family aminotransferase